MIPFNRPAKMGRELDYIRAAVETGGIGGAGEFAAKCQSLLESERRVKKALLTTSWTAPLETAALGMDARPCDEPSQASLHFGCRPRSLDVWVAERGSVA